MKIQSSQRNAAALIQTVDRKSAEVLSKDNTPYDRDFTPGSVELDRVVLQNDTSGYSEIVYGKVDQLKADIAYKEAQSSEHGGTQAVVTREVKGSKVVYTRENYGYTWDRAGDKAITDRATGEILSYRYRRGTTLPESIATIAANPLSWVLGGTVGYLVGGPGSLGLAAGIGAGVTSMAGVGVMHWAQSKGS